MGCDHEQGGKGSREKQVTKTCFQEPASMSSMTVSGESKHAAFCWRHPLKPFTEHRVHTSERATTGISVHKMRT